MLPVELLIALIIEQDLLPHLAVLPPVASAVVIPLGCYYSQAV